MKDMNSPEEKLLKLIRGASPARHASVPQAKGAGLAGFPAAKQAALSLPLIRLHLDLRRFIPLALIALFAVSLAYLLRAFLFPLAGFHSLAEEKRLMMEGSGDDALARKAVIRPLESYLKAFEQRNIFSGTSSFQVSAPAAAAAFALSKDITVVGIISGASPQAIIEDKAAGKTYYVRPGMFIGEYQVESVQEGKVILSVEGKRFELYL